MFDEINRPSDHELALLRMIIFKIKKERNIKNMIEFSKLIGFGPVYVRRVLQGRKVPNRKFINSLLFFGGVTEQQLERAYVHRDLDEYVNEKGHLIIDGVDYGKDTNGIRTNMFDE